MILGQLYAASLAHDIGNPPWTFRRKHRRVFFDRKRTKYKDQLTAKEWQDLIDFEGNANGFQYLPQADQ
jgi:dGTPase